MCLWHLPDEVNGDLDWDNSPLLNVALNELCCLQYTCDSKLGGGLGKGNQHLASDNSG